MIYCLFQIVDDKLFSNRMKNVITRFDMIFSHLSPFLSCLLIDDWYCYLFLNASEYHNDIHHSKILDETNRKEELFLCSMKITISDRRT